MEFLRTICAILFALVSFGAFAIIALFISCDLAAEQERKQALEDKKKR